MRMRGSRVSDIWLGEGLGLSELRLSESLSERSRVQGRGRETSPCPSLSSSSFRRQQGLRRRPDSSLVQEESEGRPGSYLVQEGSEGRPSSSLVQEGSEGSSEGDSGKDSGRFTDSERGSPTVGASKGRELRERGAAMLSQVSNFLVRVGQGSCGMPLSEGSCGMALMRGSSSTTLMEGSYETPLREGRFSTPLREGSCDTPRRKKIYGKPLREESCGTTSPLEDGLTLEEALQEGRMGGNTGSPWTMEETGGKGVRTGGKKHTNRVVIQLGRQAGVGMVADEAKEAKEGREGRGSCRGAPRRSCCSIETDSRGTVTVPVPFIQPLKPWI